MSIFDDANKIKPESLNQLRLHVDMLDCECPTHLIAILDKVRAFTDYTTECIIRYPKDVETHKWLASSSQNLDSLLSATIAQLARYEGFVNDENEFVPRQR